MKPRHFVFPGCVVLLCLWTSCGGSRSSDALAQSRSSYEPDTVSPLRPVDEGLKVRPDVLLLPFAFRQETEALEPAVPKLKAAVEHYVRATAEASKVEVAVKMTGVGLEYGKRMGQGDAVAQGVLEVALPESLDFWGRSALVATLMRVGSLEAAAAEKGNTGLRVSFGAPAPRVRDPEARRAELMKRWVERARGFISQAESERAPLQLVGCAPPDAVKQESLSVDEAVLSLAVSCRLDVVTK